MVNVGLGETQVNGLLASLNIPTITQNSLKEREREVGNQLALMAEESCRQHLSREIEMSEGNLSASFDGAWQKRGTGRAYNSLTGHASLFGEKTKKIIGYSVMAKKCRICAAAKIKAVPPRKHKCSVNWTGSAKAMEPAMACQMLKIMTIFHFQVTTLIMDNDSTTLARVKASVNPNISKKSDSNHTKKGFTGSLIELSNQYKVLRNVKVRGHIERCFMYCVHHNKSKEKQLQDDLKNIVPHLYGEHHGCGSWCKSEKTNYKHKNLPYGKPLSCATYSSKIGFEDEDIDLQDIDLNPLNASPESSSLLYFDLETAGLQRTPDILQIAALCDNQSLNIYMTPNQTITEGASRATGLTYEGGILKHHGQPLDAEVPAKGLEQFVDFVRSSSKPFVIGYNIQNFDIPVLMFHLQKCNLVHVFEESVSGFIDTYKLSKKVFDKATVGNYKQENLVKCLLGVEYEAHNALSDVNSLRKLYEEKLSKNYNSSDVFTLSYYNVRASLEPLVQKKVISSLISKRLINCSLSLNRLKLIHKRDPQNGIQNVFSEPMSASKTPQISKSKNVINKVVQFMNTC
ncbi:uncharacterized protein LOC125656742 [Ostrea edulis]|uniref:uncharacterized protein LOC125656742 n=1 Tax=Ostrea edulis TaxID=37623 RepID=UPI0024AF3A0C|nr:uncharacterized protein LOC125656742 [Ostrea edulis]